MAVMNSLLYNILDDVIDESRILIEKSGIRSLSSREIQTAVRLNFPGELAKHAVSEGTKAVTKYNAYENDDGAGKTKEEKAGLSFGIGPIQKILKEKLRYNVHILASVYMAASLEYICAELLELSGNCARDLKVKRIIPSHIGFAIRGDEDLDKLFPGTVAGAGVVPHIHHSLVSKLQGIELVDETGSEGSGLGFGSGGGAFGVSAQPLGGFGAVSAGFGSGSTGLGGEGFGGGSVGFGGSAAYGGGVFLSQNY